MGKLKLNLNLKLKSRFFCCLLFLILSLAGCAVVINLHAVRKQVITVWMPLPDFMTEQETLETWERLTANFETLYPGFGIALSVYDADAWEDVCADAGTSPDAEAPVMWINPPEKYEIPKADLSGLFCRLDPACYIPDFLESPKFPDSPEYPDQIALSWNIPVVYSSDLEQQGKIIDRSNLPADSWQSDPDAVLDAFLEDPRTPVLSDSSRLSMIERTPRTSGAVCMIPVTEQNLFTVQYQDYCIINPDADRNAQEIATLWIGYLLSEQAQGILYTEHYGNFPVQKTALAGTFSQHQALSIIADLAVARGDFL